jgi:hypothetical protein
MTLPPLFFEPISRMVGNRWSPLRADETGKTASLSFIDQEGVHGSDEILTGLCVDKIEIEPSGEPSAVRHSKCS